MTLISVHNSDGCVGRCDARCYNATHPHCDCICGGKNHGVGPQQAELNTREMTEELTKKIREQKPGSRLEFSPVQEDLFANTEGVALEKNITGGTP